MGIFDYPGSGGGSPSPWAGVLGELGQGIGAIFAQKTAQKAQKKMAKQAASYGMGWGENLPSVFRSKLPIPRGPSDAWQDAFNKRSDNYYGVTPYQDPTPGPWSLEDPRSRDGGPRRIREPHAPSRLEIPDPSGKLRTYKLEGRCLVSTTDLSTVKRVSSVLGQLRSALEGRPTGKRRARRCYTKSGRVRKPRKSGSKRRRVSARVLSPKQLAAGFGGSAYRRQ